MIFTRFLLKRSLTTPPTRFKIFTVEMLKENGPALLGILTAVGAIGTAIASAVGYVESLKKDVAVSNERIKAIETNCEAKIKASEASNNEAIAKAVLHLSFHGDYEKYRAWLYQTQADKPKVEEPVEYKSK